MSYSKWILICLRSYTASQGMLGLQNILQKKKKKLTKWCAKHFSIWNSPKPSIFFLANILAWMNDVMGCKWVNSQLSLLFKRINAIWLALIKKRTTRFVEVIVYKSKTRCMHESWLMSAIYAGPKIDIKEISMIDLCYYSLYTVP